MFDENIRGDPVKLLKYFVSIRSDTATSREVDVEKAIGEYLAGIPHFRAGRNFGIELLPGDKLGRGIVWALLAGGGTSSDRAGTGAPREPDKRCAARRAIVLMNHHDVVDTFDYGRLQSLACDCDGLLSRMKALVEDGSIDLSGEVKADMDSGQWLFGRGTCDMKSGMVVQLIALERLAERAESLGVDVLYLSVPDEETVSWGMRHGVRLLCKLKERFDLDYWLMVDSEAHTRSEAGLPAFYDGSIGKTMLSVYVKGVKSHIGDISNGLNPALIMANIVGLSELDRGVAEVEDGVHSPPPTWSYVRDFKECYDASIPEAAGGYISFLPMTRKPGELLDFMKAICEAGMERAIARFHEAFSDYDRGRPVVFPHKARVMLFGELLEDARKHDPGEIDSALSEAYRDCEEAMAAGLSSMPECNFRIVKTLLDHVPYGGPVAVIALSPPYYPNISNGHMERLAPDKSLFAGRLADLVRVASENIYPEGIERRPYFMGISDLSYVARLDPATIARVRGNMPLLDSVSYFLPFEEMAGIAMPILDIGAWGKDPHKFTERVYIPDVAEAVPALYVELILGIAESFN